MSMALMAAAAAVSVGAQLLGGASKSAAYRQSAESAYNTALWNAENILKTGTDNIMLTGMSGRTNAMQQMMATAMNVSDIKQVAEFNMGLQKKVTEYNTAMLLDELPQLMAQYDLSITHIRQQGAKQEGGIVAYQGASGTVIGTGSNLDVVVDSKTQLALDEYAVGMQYQWNVDAVYDAIAKGEWEGQMAIDKMAFEANQQVMNMKNQTSMAVFSILSSNTLQMFSIANTAMNQADTALWQGASQSATYESAADAAWTSAVIKAGGTALSAAINYGASSAMKPPADTGERFVNMPEPIRSTAVTGSQSDFYQSILNYKTPGSMSTWTPGSSLLEG